MRRELPPEAPAEPVDPELARQIEDLMRQPVKGRPPITVIGDDDVFAITPAPRD